MAFYPLEKLHQLFDGYSRAFRVEGRDLLLVQSNGQVHLIENRCPHMDAPLTHATLNNGYIRCPLHGIEFNLVTGQGSCPQPLTHYEPIYEGNKVGIDLAS